MLEDRDLSRRERRLRAKGAALGAAFARKAEERRKRIAEGAVIPPKPPDD